VHGAVPGDERVRADPLSNGVVPLAEWDLAVDAALLFALGGVDLVHDDETQFSHQQVMVDTAERAVVDDGLDAVARDVVHRADEAYGLVGLVASFGDPAHREDQASVGHAAAYRDRDQVVPVDLAVVAVVLLGVGVLATLVSLAIEGSHDGAIAVDGAARVGPRARAGRSREQQPDLASERHRVLGEGELQGAQVVVCLLYTSRSPDRQ